MSDSIKCVCPQCGAKYRLPVEAQGRAARCKKCGAKFSVPKPKERGLEDSVLDWLTEPMEEDDVIDQPRVINIPKGEGGAGKRRGIIRMREDDAGEETKKPEEAASPKKV